MHNDGSGRQAKHNGVPAWNSAESAWHGNGRVEKFTGARTEVKKDEMLPLETAVSINLALVHRCIDALSIRVHKSFVVIDWMRRLLRVQRRASACFAPFRAEDVDVGSRV